uniref:Uncharacterized protein LOC113798786 isoform X2 n=1 Tax=Dermatophagoides pteronyssinus TaxID=6956 RepID=A0A6P6YK95_DERPT|nr:uncharacterized protein LOC113798786 isoform X2 [Dermatophagoides pteronyssinus]
MDSNSHQYQQQQQQHQQQQSHHAYQTNHQMSQQPSRPPSVDSVNLGSIYSGFYPQASSAGPSSLTTNIPPTVQNSYQFSGQYPQSLHQNQQQHQGYQNYPINSNNEPASWSLHGQTNYQHSTSQQPTSLPPNLSYHYQISASAAAAAAFGFNYQQQQQQQQQHPNQNVGMLVSPTSSNHHNINAVPLTSAVQWPVTNPIQSQSSFIPAMTNQILSPSHHPQQHQPFTSMAAAAAGITNPNEYVSQYYSQYYREYYQRLVAFHKHQQQIQNQKKIAPLKYNQFHTPCSFSQHDNQLIVVEANSNVGLYGLQEVFIEQCYPNLYLQSLLYTNNDDPNLTLLPFEDSQSSLDWIRVKQLNDTTMNYELKLILKLITMLFRQNGTLSGLDLSELLYELVQPNNGDDSEKLSQSGGSEVVTKDYYRDLLSHLRQLLMRGQRRVAITFAQNNGLFDHAMALSYLFSFLSSSLNTTASTNLGQVIDNNLMISTIKKFITSTLSTDDPLYVFYTHLLQIASNILNSVTLENGGMIPSSGSGTTASAKIDRLESFIILLANDIKFDKVEIADKSYRNLIDLMIALLKDDFNYVLPDELFNNDRFDCLLVNECLEFARFRGERLNPKLMLRKLEFAFELFDFGFTRNALRYLTKIADKLKDPKFEWKMLIDKKSKYSKWLLPDSIMNSEDEQLDSKLLKNIWAYQFSKIFTRMDKELQLFDSPLFAVEQKEVPKNDDKNDDQQHNDDDVEADDADVTCEEDEDRTDVVEDIEDEEIDVELDTSESSFSKPEPHNQSISTSLSSNQQDNYKQHNQRQSPQQNIDDRRHSTMMMSTLSTNHTPVQDKSLNVSSIEPVTVNQNNMITDNQNSLPIKPAKSLPPQGFMQQGARRSLPTIANHTFPRTLNPIMEIPQTNHMPSATESTTTIHQQKSFDSLDSSSPPSSPNDNFNMKPMQSALPSSFQNNEDLTGQKSDNHHTENTENIGSNNSYSNFFQPPPTSSNDTTAPFDFISTNGHVTSIPTYDPYFNTNESTLNDQTSSNGLVDHKNNEFLQNANTIPPSVNNNVNETMKKPEINSNNNNNNNGGESAKTSPSKSNNGGLLGAILGRLKPKNQMILPDDKDPQIIFDPVSKRWIDKSANDQGGMGTGGLPPPPKIPIPGGNTSGGQSEPNSAITSPTSMNNFPHSSTLPSLQQSNTNKNSNDIPPMMMMNGVNPFGAASLPPASSTTGSTNNAFRTDLRRKRYVDVFNPSK